jgi:hypothetical protein
MAVALQSAHQVSGAKAAALAVQAVRDLQQTFDKAILRAQP